MRALVTGATGMVGINLIESLARDPEFEVVALVRPSSDTSALPREGVEFRHGDLGHAASLRGVCEGIDAVFHCAALVSDWGMREEMIRVNITGLQALLDEAVRAKVGRLVLVSSMAVLGNRPQADVDETAPYLLTGDNYNYTKMEAEKIALATMRQHGLSLVILRPPYIYGPHDRQFLPRVIGAVEREQFVFVGDGTNPISLCYVGNLVDALIRAAKSPNAAGRIYHITDGPPVTRRQLVFRLADELGLMRPRKHLPPWLAKTLMHIMETKAKLFRAKEAPLLNRFRLKFLFTPLSFSIRRAQEELGYGPPFTFEQGLKTTLEWFKSGR